jgi:hypothetical protein
MVLSRRPQNMRAKKPPTSSKSSHASAHHDESHDRAAAIAEDVSKGEKQELAHG